MQQAEQKRPKRKRIAKTEKNSAGVAATANDKVMVGSAVYEKVGPAVKKKAQVG